MRAGTGYHAKVVKTAKGDLDCARCHTEHYGENFNIIKWPTLKEEFDHTQTGYALLGKHAGLKCERCHNPKHILAAKTGKIVLKDLNKTLLGLSPACLTCHDDAHRGQLGTDCARCHGFDKWKPAEKFNHGLTKYPLTGKHTNVECVKCHVADQGKPKYKGLAFASCGDCHKDPHKGAFKARCDSCHDTGDWHNKARTTLNFDHSKTPFPLKGKHEEVACNKCHKTADFSAKIPHERCLDCHKDQHNGQFATRKDGGDCAACHTEETWKKTTFDAAAHKTTKFPLEGKHFDTQCAKCHIPQPAAADTNYHPKFAACLDCHKDEHNGQFAGGAYKNRCEECHNLTGWKPSSFAFARHQKTRFALSGAHAAVTCVDCHHGPDAHNPKLVRFHYDNMKCESCHRDPHGGGGGVSPVLTKVAAGQSACEACHTVKSWRTVLPFDHDKTDYPLIGTHKTLACADCHRPKGTGEEFTLNFKEASRECWGCHEDIHGGQFDKGGKRAECASCHNSTRWAAVLFDHNTKTKFALTGAHDKVPCRDCHNQTKEVAGRKVVLYTLAPKECSACHKDISQ